MPFKENIEPLQKIFFLFTPLLDLDLDLDSKRTDGNARKARKIIPCIIPVCRRKIRIPKVESQPRDIPHLYRKFDGYPQHKTYRTYTTPGVFDTTHQVSQVSWAFFGLLFLDLDPVTQLNHE